MGVTASMMRRNNPSSLRKKKVMNVTEKRAITALATPDTREPRKFCSFSGLKSRSTCAPIVSERESVDTFSEK